MNQTEYQVSGRNLIIRLPYEVDDHNCKAVRDTSELLLKENHIRCVIFDFSETGFMDSTGIGILLNQYHKMKEIGGEVVVCGEDPRVRRILKISGIYQIIRHI